MQKNNSEFLSSVLSQPVLGWLVLISCEAGDQHLYDDFPLHKGKNVIGTHNDCDIVMPYTRFLPLVHGSIRCDNKRFIYTDFDTDEGSCINGKPVTNSSLKDGDILVLGQLHFIFHHLDYNAAIDDEEKRLYKYAKMS